MPDSRSSWKSNAGFLLAAIGSAIGLGNVWRFSYMAHQYGGGAFLVPYVVALIVAGIPIILLEYGVGHLEKGSSPLSFARISRKWEWIGWWMPVVALFGIMLYYSAIIGWCVNYLIFSFKLSWGADPEAFFFKDFLQLTDSPSTLGRIALGGVRLPILAATMLVWGLCWLICYRDIRHGIEKASVVFMPVLFLLTLVMVVWTLFLDGARDAILNNYLHADWSKINLFSADPVARQAAGEVWSAAFSQIFFTLSLGFGIMIAYASYLPDNSNIGRNAFITASVNCLYSFIAGFAVFGIVGFMAHSQGVEFDAAIKGGPQLAFVVYPKAISLLPSMNALFGVLFFLMLVIAGLTSGVSLIEAFTCAVTDKFDLAREKVVSIVCLLGFIGSLVFTTRGGLYVLDIADHFITNYGLVLGGIVECLIVGWILKAAILRKHIRILGLDVTIVWDMLVKYVTPAILVYLLYLSFAGDISKPYEGYPGCSLLFYGLGLMAVCLAVALLLTFQPWKPEKLKRRHRPEEDDLLV